MCDGTLGRRHGGWGGRGWVTDGQLSTQPGAASPSLDAIWCVSGSVTLGRWGGGLFPCSHFVQDEIHIYPPPLTRTDNRTVVSS